MFSKSEDRRHRGGHVITIYKTFVPRGRGVGGESRQHGNIINSQKYPIICPRAYLCAYCGIFYNTTAPDLRSWIDLSIRLVFIKFQWHISDALFERNQVPISIIRNIMQKMNNMFFFVLRPFLRRLAVTMNRVSF